MHLAFLFQYFLGFSGTQQPQEYCLSCYFPPSLGVTFSSILCFSTSSLGLPWWVSCKEPACQCRRCKKHGFDPWVRKTPWRRDRLPTPVFLGFPGGSAGEESACNVEDLGSIPGSGRSPGGRHDSPLQYSCLETPMDRSAWRSQRVKHDCATEHVYKIDDQQRPIV